VLHASRDFPCHRAPAPLRGNRTGQRCVRSARRSEG
jgi:hypothetical protein